MKVAAIVVLECLATIAGSSGWSLRPISNVQQPPRERSQDEGDVRVWVVSPSEKVFEFPEAVRGGVGRPRRDPSDPIVRRGGRHGRVDDPVGYSEPGFNRYTPPKLSPPSAG